MWRRPGGHRGGEGGTDRGEEQEAECDRCLEGGEIPCVGAGLPGFLRPIILLRLALA